jgi:hypothetical protein
VAIIAVLADGKDGGGANSNNSKNVVLFNKFSPASLEKF